MSEIRKPNRTSATFAKSANEVAYGQLVLVSARWVLILVGLVLTIWDPAPVNTLRVQILIIIMMAVANFYLHAQALMKKPIDTDLIYAASAADLLVVSIFVLIDGGFRAPIFTFYFPAVMAFAVVFPTKVTAVYTTAAAGAYAFICLFSFARQVVTGLDGTQNLQVLVVRIIILIAIAVCGNVFLRIERTRRTAAEKSRQEFIGNFEQ